MDASQASGKLGTNPPWIMTGYRCFYGLEAQRPGGRFGPEPEVVVLRVHKQRVGIEGIDILATGLPFAANAATDDLLPRRSKGQIHWKSLA